MPRGRRTSLVITLSREDLLELRSWQRSTTIPAGLARRGRIILLLSSGASVSDVSRTVGIQRPHVYKWAHRFIEHGIGGLRDKSGRGLRRSAALALSPTPDQDFSMSDDLNARRVGSTWCPAPITDLETKEMIRSIKGYPILTGLRGEKGVDTGIIMDCLLRLSQLVIDFECIQEIDINPFMVESKANKSFIVDARILAGR